MSGTWDRAGDFCGKSGGDAAGVLGADAFLESFERVEERDVVGSACSSGTGVRARAAAAGLVFH